MKLTSYLLILLILIYSSLSYASESTDNALFKGTNPLLEAMGKPVYANRVYLSLVQIHRRFIFVTRFGGHHIYTWTGDALLRY